jgi:2-succinyl-5-enolpyruvyl-6-hydroxy-3-cyclohexene-1-carboxylate synthase
VNAQIVIALLKANGIKRVVASPGTTNIPITGSVQNDPFFEVYSAADERSAAYMACGLAHETGEPVVLSCTGATASRNYMPAMTEAYYRKLPVVAITSTASIVEVGHLLPQCIDRSVIPKDVANISIHLPPVKDKEDFWDCEIKTNKAMLQVKRAGGGPVHINLVTSYAKTFNTQQLPAVRAIQRYFYHDDLPAIDPSKRIAVFIGAHREFTSEETSALECFARTHNAVVFCDHTSSYKGFGRVLGSLACFQKLYERAAFTELQADMVIHIGEISGDYPTLSFIGASDCPVWRISEDGELRDRFKKLSCMFEMREQDFFRKHSEGKEAVDPKYLTAWQNYSDGIRARIPEIPFSNTWIASELSGLIPRNSTIHFGILNSLRNWNLYETDANITTACNVGGFGIDGSVSTIIGAALADKNKLFYAIIGDLAFFYDISALGNRHLPTNLRILLINNGGGCEFELSSHFGSQFGEQTGDFISAAGHYGSKSNKLMKNMAEDLGFSYLAASNKESFRDVMQAFVSSGPPTKPMLFECFTDFEDESRALELLSSIDTVMMPNLEQRSPAKKIIQSGVDETVKIMMKTLPWSVKKSLRKALE